MTVNYTEVLGIRKPTATTKGWATELLSSYEIIEARLAGAEEVTASGGTVSLATKPAGATQSNLPMTYKFTGTLSSNLAASLATRAGEFLLWHAGSGTSTITAKVAGGSNTITLQAGYITHVWNDGSELYEVGATGRQGDLATKSLATIVGTGLSATTGQILPAFKDIAAATATLLTATATTIDGIVGVQGNTTILFSATQVIPSTEDVQAAFFAYSSSGDGGDATSGGWRDDIRLFSEEYNEISGASVSAAGIISIPAGKYQATFGIQFHKTNGSACRLYNNSNSSELILGGVIRAPSGTAVGVQSIGSGAFTATGASNITIQYLCESTRATDGLGIDANIGTNQVYKFLSLMRLGNA